MDEILYEALIKYYNTLDYTGYISKKQRDNLLLLAFYRDFVFNDYRGILSEEDYLLIERVLDSIYGTSCLIPYPNYVKMGKLYLSEVTELAARIKALEETSVVKVMQEDNPNDTTQSDVVIRNR